MNQTLNYHRNQHPRRRRWALAGLSLIICHLPFCPAGAQTWTESYLNQPSNVRYESLNPTRLSYNAVQETGVATVGYELQKGDFHAVDQSGDAHHLDAYIGGLRQAGRFSLAGHLRYQNQKENDQRWNSTLWNYYYNPFLLCDSVAGDASTEWFDMNAAASYAFSDRLRGGLELGLRTGSRADQTDPRPRTTTAILPVTAGVDYRLTPDWSLGVAAGVRLQSSIIEYTKGGSYINSHRYFLMKGMGDYAKRSSGDESGYKRDYQGTSYHAALTAVWQPTGSRWANFAEASVASNHQNATDGGTSYSFNGGDYAETVVSLQDRLLWQPSPTTLHNLTLNASFATGKATWYDQKRELDQEHGSVILYRVLSKSTIQESQRLAASLHYQLDLLRDGRRDVTIEARAGLNSISRKQYQGLTTPEQNIQFIDLQAQVAKTLYINKVSIRAQLGGGYRLPGTRDYANGSAYTGEDDIQAPYTRRVFEYESCSRLRLHALADASTPLSSQRLTVGAYAQCRYDAYTDSEDYWAGYDGQHLTTVDVGLYLKF